MSEELYAELEGAGHIQTRDGAQLTGTRHYSIQIWRRLIPNGRGGHLPGLKRFAGYFAFDGFEGHKVMASRSADVVLMMEDGRELPVQFSSSNGTFILGSPHPDWLKDI